mmetsp:Transcript_25827/g.103175  ORF Transcript_25827/g.103175 Transcript_25827/m.103175 type:complete len:143 (-) Transcript_25827:546-974(-)
MSATSHRAPTVRDRPDDDDAEPWVFQENSAPVEGDVALGGFDDACRTRRTAEEEDEDGLEVGLHHDFAARLVDDDDDDDDDEDRPVKSTKPVSVDSSKPPPKETEMMDSRKRVVADTTARARKFGRTVGRGRLLPMYPECEA